MHTVIFGVLRVREIFGSRNEFVVIEVSVLARHFPAFLGFV
jgi:hypothetical protein